MYLLLFIENRYFDILLLFRLACVTWRLFCRSLGVDNLHDVTASRAAPEPPSQRTFRASHYLSYHQTGRYAQPFPSQLSDATITIEPIDTAGRRFVSRSRISKYGKWIKEQGPSFALVTVITTHARQTKEHSVSYVTFVC